MNNDSTQSSIFNPKLFIKIIILVIIVYFLSQSINLYDYIFNIKLYYKDILVLVVLFVGTWVFLDISLELIKKFFEKKGDIREYPIIELVFKIVVWAIAILIGLSYIFKGLSSLIMSLGMVGAALTFALQQPILNFAGWLSIVILRPFKINDRIYIPNIGTGDVYRIDTMHIYLREISDLDESTGRTLIIPNSQVLTNSITNYTRGSPYIWNYIDTLITYESDWKLAEHLIFTAAYEVVGKEMEQLAEIWKNKPRKYTYSKINPKPVMRVFFKDSGINIRVRYLVKSYEWAEVKTKITRKILEKINSAENVEIAYPHMEVLYRPKYDIEDSHNNDNKNK